MKIFTRIALSLLCSMPVLSLAKDATTLVDQIVYVSLPQLMAESNQGKEANANLEKFRATEAETINGFVKKYEKSKNDFEKANKELEAKRGIVKDPRAEEEKVTKLGREVAKCESNLKEEAEYAQKRFQAKYMELSEQLFKDQVESIAQWGQEMKVAAVVDADSGRVLYRRETVDVTKEILKVVDVKHEQKVAKAKTPAPAAPTKVASTPAASTTPLKPS